MKKKKEESAISSAAAEKIQKAIGPMTKVLRWEVKGQWLCAILGSNITVSILNK